MLLEENQQWWSAWRCSLTQMIWKKKLLLPPYSSTSQSVLFFSNHLLSILHFMNKTRHAFETTIVTFNIAFTVHCHSFFVLLFSLKVNKIITNNKKHMHLVVLPKTQQSPLSQALCPWQNTYCLLQKHYIV